jgi:hypothetical protein
MDNIVLDAYGVKISVPRETLMLIPYFRNIITDLKIDLANPIPVKCDPRGMYSVLDYVLYPAKPFPTKWEYLLDYFCINV